MHRTQWPRAGVEVPGIGVGTWGHGGARLAGGHPMGWSGHDESQAVQALLAAHAAGLTHWDTADVYGGGAGERLIGRLWKQVPRESIFLATKVGWAAGEHGHPYHPLQIRAQIDASLQPGDRAYRPLLLSSLRARARRPLPGWCGGGVPARREEGKIRFIGLSDWRTALVVRYAERVQPDVVQVYRNLLEDDYAASGLKDWAEARGVGVAFFSPLMHGLLLGRYVVPPALGEGDHRLRVPAFRDPVLLAHLRRCRQEVEARFFAHPEPVLHALVGTLLADSPNACVLVGLRRPEHVEAAARVGDVLSPVDAEWVRQLYNRLPAGTGPVRNPWCS